MNDANPLNILTDSGSSSSLLSSIEGTNKYAIDGPLNNQQINHMFAYLFPEDDSSDAYKYINEPVSKVSLKIYSKTVHFLTEFSLFQFDPQKVKSAFPDSLVHRLSCLLAISYSYLSGRKAVAQLWAEFINR